MIQVPGSSAVGRHNEVGILEPFRVPRYGDRGGAYAWEILSVHPISGPMAVMGRWLWRSSHPVDILR